MRNFVKLCPTFWTGDTGLALREAGAGPQLLALYLLSSPHTNYIGLFRLPLAYLAADLGLSVETAREYLHAIERTGFAKYDHRTETTWVVEAAHHQIGELKDKDKVVVLVQREYDAVPKGCPFLDEFHAKYVGALHLRPRNGAALSQPAKTEPPAPAKVEPKAPAQVEQPAPAAAALAEDTAPPSSLSVGTVNIEVRGEPDQHTRAVMASLERLLLARDAAGLGDRDGDHELVSRLLETANSAGFDIAQHVIDAALTAGDYTLRNFAKYEAAAQRACGI